MATLVNAKSGLVHPLPARTLVGRGDTCSCRLDDRWVSGEHASLIWTQDGWVIRDLGSRNGTFVNQDRLEAGHPQKLEVGDRLDFGHLDDPWEFSDAAAPSAIAVNLRTGEICTATEGILGIPAAHPEVTVYADARGRWWKEQRDVEPESVRDDDLVVVADIPWKIRLPAAQEGTAKLDHPRLDSIRLRFAVSRDEEHVVLTVIHRGREIPLEPREHGYVLLTLARTRMREAHLPPNEQGWIDRNDLLRDLRTDSNGLNVAIYRARGQLASAGIDGAAGIVEVRRGKRRIGLPADRMEEVPL